MELGNLMQAQVERTRQLAAAAAAATAAAAAATSGATSSGVMSEGEALMALMRAQWDVSRTVQLSLQQPKAVTAQHADVAIEAAADMDESAGAGETSGSGETGGAGEAGGWLEELMEATAAEDETLQGEAAGALEAPMALEAAGSMEAARMDTSSADVSDAICEAVEPVCGICYDSPSPPSSLLSLACTHAFCSNCWGQLLMVALERGPACIHDTCPEPGCDTLITADVWSTTLPPAGLDTLHQVAIRSFVEHNSLLAFCPTASCGKAAAHAQPLAPPELLGCRCGASFCVLCSEPPHWPLSCACKKKWQELLNTSPDAHAIMQLTRPCPKCGVRTQRSHGTWPSMYINPWDTILTPRPI